MRVIRAEHLGMCFGVRDAIKLAQEISRQGPLTVLGDLVHNETVLADLNSQGIEFSSEIAGVGTQKVMITAHGASERRLSAVRERGHTLLEATCPLVHFAHRELGKLVLAGCYPVVIGLREHVEVRGLTEDLAEFSVVLTESDVARLPMKESFGIVAQTTQPIEKVRGLVALIKERFPHADLCFVDTVCQPTKQRQSAAVELAQRCDVVLVVGGTNSNNTRELVATCRRYCERVHHVQSANNLRLEWFTGTDMVGITAGTSTPDEVVDQIERRLNEMPFTISPATGSTTQTMETYELCEMDQPLHSESTKAA